MSTETSNKGGIFVGHPHSKGGIPLIVEETGQKIEVEGEEPLIPSEIDADSKIYELEGTNIEILDEINKMFGAKGMAKAATEIHAGDMVVCKRSAGDDTKRKYKGTLKQIVSAVNQSGGCNEIEKGAVEYRDGKQIQYKDGGAIGVLSISEVEHKLGRKLHWWNDDVVEINGAKFKKVFLKSEYKRV